jgi:hypothetical protein
MTRQTFESVAHLQQPKEIFPKMELQLAIGATVFNVFFILECSSTLD